MAFAITGFPGASSRGAPRIRRCPRRRQTMRTIASASAWDRQPDLRPVPNSAEDSEAGALPGAGFAGDLNLTNELILAITVGEVPDQEVNDIVWFLMGYVREPDGSWNTDAVPSPWKEAYPQPPDFIGVTREYSPKVDAPVKRANQNLMFSVPKEYKLLLKKEVGFKGFKVDELTPNLTRRAQVACWICYYRKVRCG